MEKCMMCDEQAVWERCTQFAGDHPFCQKHAEMEEDFMCNDDYEFWREIKKDEPIEKIDGTVENWENQLLGADERYVKRAPVECEKLLEAFIESCKPFGFTTKEIDRVIDNHMEIRHYKEREAIHDIIFDLHTFYNLKRG